ncbi:mitochondrial inner membrane protein OXA1-like [Salvia miltiorrhiza]|uniref:mitochondrial inner membrane protein OXA1-like n=1 Tax=Salvia miltiorrhiza TaxID=226208 RepID=UPI0025AB927D|nr:mitochondrial inner membrane protein OXA1-like [Salvia miltiorrhiza]XP_057786339.1 mitochondrial inner membrane protein OXA1-like [Salvia miltiorrhiza]
MAYRQSIIARTRLFYQQQQRFAPSFSHISSSDREESPAKSIGRNCENRTHFLITRNNAGNSLLSGNVSRLMRSEIPAGYGLIFHRNISNVGLDIEVPAADLDGVIDVVADKASEAAPILNEVAIAAADSYAPVAAYQYLIDYVHCYTGFEWWASIAAVTVLIRFIELPFVIHRLKFPLKIDAGIGAQLSVALQSVSSNDLEKALFNLIKVLASLGKVVKEEFMRRYFFNVNKLLFFLAILNMAENVPSFVTGGTLWLTDLTTPDRLYLPILLTLTYWIRIKVEPSVYLRGATLSNTGAAVVSASALFESASALLVTVIAGFPTAFYCYAITSNLFSISYGIVMRNPLVHKSLGLSRMQP